jgi:hypothetical protein
MVNICLLNIRVYSASYPHISFQIYARDWTLPFKVGNEAVTFSPRRLWQKLR